MNNGILRTIRTHCALIPFLVPETKFSCSDVGMRIFEAAWIDYREIVLVVPPRFAYGFSMHKRRYVHAEAIFWLEWRPMRLFQ